MFVQHNPDRAQAEEAGCANVLASYTRSHKCSNNSSNNNNNTSNNHFMPVGKHNI
jgi:hypothetical protein